MGNKKDNQKDQDLEKVRHEESVKYMLDAYDKKKKLKDFVKGMIATGLVVGTVLTGAGCKTNTVDPIDPPVTTDPSQTITDPVGPDDTTNPNNPNQPTGPDTPDNPPVDQTSIDKMYEALDLISELNDGKTVSEIYIQLYNQGQSAEISFGNLEYDENYKTNIHKEMPEYGCFQIPVEQYQKIRSALGLRESATRSGFMTPDKFISKMGTEELDYISGIIFERRNKEVNYEKLTSVIDELSKKYNTTIKGATIYTRGFFRDKNHNGFRLEDEAENEICDFVLNQEEFEHIKENMDIESACTTNFGKAFFNRADSKTMEYLIEYLQKELAREEPTK